MQDSEIKLTIEFPIVQIGEISMCSMNSVSILVLLLISAFYFWVVW